ncbi:MAG: hypothetical protein QOH90_2399 [Actinomycetota bacterium]|jgi:hypothetical protein|nr:hypothetical protein [Actinomycetota bacterium]
MKGPHIADKLVVFLGGIDSRSLVIIGEIKKNARDKYRVDDEVVSYNKFGIYVICHVRYCKEIANGNCGCTQPLTY